MSKHKQSSSKHGTRQSQGRTPPPDQFQQGLRAFDAGNFDGAITVWSPLAQRDPRVQAALAEAFFRRAITHHSIEARVSGLEYALRLAPGETRYQYHLGLARHLAGDLAAAIRHYHVVLDADRDWPGAAMVLAVASLEQDAHTDLAALPGSTPAVRAALAPVQVLLQGDIPAPAGDSPLDRLWQGLGRLRAGESVAGDILADGRPLPSAAADAVRHYYLGVAAAQAGDPRRALEAWQHPSVTRLDRPWLRDNLVAVLLQRLAEQLASDDTAGAAVTAQQALPFAGGSTALAEAIVVASDRAAHAAATGGDWEQAVALWETARDAVSSVPGLGSPRPLLHNLALAYEAQERWLEAAEAWRAMLRTRPRRRDTRAGDEPAATRPAASSSTQIEMSDAQWAWVRRRVVESYKRAGAPGEAVAVFRQALKADPGDLETRLQLAEALLANDQAQAASNELQRILQIDPRHVEAQLRLASLHIEQSEWQAAEQYIRRVLAQQPAHAEAQRYLVRLLLAHGTALHEAGQLAAARRRFEEGQQTAPDDYRFPLNLARITVDQRKSGQIRPLLERALELGADQPAAYISIIDCWAAADQLAEARAVLARAEAELTLAPDFYLELGTSLLAHETPVPLLGSPFGLPLPRPAPTDTPRSLFATEVLDRAIALRPDDPGLRLSIAAGLVLSRVDLALTYAEAAAKLSPDDPNVLLMLGLVLELNDRTRDAKQTLRRAARLARQQGRRDLAEHADTLYRGAGDPFFRMMLQMGPLLGDLELDPGDLFF